MEVTLEQIGQPITQGKRADIYPWPSGKMLKLYRGSMPWNRAAHEAGALRAAAQAGVRVPQVGEIVEVNGRQGLLFERVQGSSLLSTITARPWRIPQAARLLAALQAQLHNLPAPDLPPFKESLARRIRSAGGLPGRLKVAALIRLSELSGSDHFCHGSLHPRHVLLAPRGPVLIDWLDAGRGQALADVCSTSLLLGYGELLHGQRLAWVETLARYWFRKIYLQHYFHLRLGSWSDYEVWLPVVGAAHLAGDVLEAHDRLLAFVEKELR